MYIFKRGDVTVVEFTLTIWNNKLGKQYIIKGVCPTIIIGEDRVDDCMIAEVLPTGENEKMIKLYGKLFTANFLFNIMSEYEMTINDWIEHK